MSVIVTNLVKSFGEQKAVNDVTFEAKKGEVLGFLGPNGAGKTTTMKIVTCFIPQTSGTVEVCGHNVADEPFAVRQKIGYLPEHNPVYKDMYIKEYLSFVAGLHKVKNKRKRVGEMIEMTGLGREQHKKIGTLSKGYRQRVGLAQAMLHDPEVLILDEPTSGLDPNQLVEIRSLIKQLGEEKTVIFSTHIMQEVQLLCDRVMIIDQGKMVANDTIDTLKSKVGGEAVVTVEFLQKTNAAALKKIKQVREVRALPNNKFQLVAPLNADVRADVFQFAVANNLVLIEMRKEVFSVEDVFTNVTAKGINANKS